jgi:hypothetical protein
MTKDFSLSVIEMKRVMRTEMRVTEENGWKSWTVYSVDLHGLRRLGDCTSAKLGVCRRKGGLNEGQGQDQGVATISTPIHARHSY